MILTEWQKELLEADRDEVHNMNRRAVVKNSDYLWPNGIVPYVLDSSLSELRSAILIYLALKVNNFSFQIQEP